MKREPTDQMVEKAMRRFKLKLDRLRMKQRLQQCWCGSGEYPNANYDGHGIFLCYSCSKCHAEKMKGYRPDIFESYECDEPIEED